MNKSVLMVLAVIIALLSGWLLLEVASPGVGQSGGSASVVQQRTPYVTQSQIVQMTVDIEVPTAITVEVE